MKQTLCWMCRRPGTGTCSWDKSFTPVEGWTATSTKLMSWHEGEDIGSYLVEACPLFQEVDMKKRDKAYIKVTGLPDALLHIYICAGLSDEEIAERCCLSVKEVHNRRLLYLKNRERRGGEGT